MNLQVYALNSKTKAEACLPLCQVEDSGQGSGGHRLLLDEENTKILLDCGVSYL